MNFVERIFGISPDGGSALFEWSLLLTPFLGFMATAVPCSLETLRKQSFVKKLQRYVRSSYRGCLTTK
jgi:hypothetical protein